MNKLEEIFALQSEAEKIEYLKKGRRTPMPNVARLMDDWDPDRHDVMDERKRPESKVISEDARVDPRTGRAIPATYTKDDITPTNRIPLPIEQNFTNIHTAWCVGNDPKVDCEPNDESEKELLQIVDRLNRKNKMRYNNKRIVRSWLSETEVAEYWYTVEDTGFWTKVLRALKKIAGKSDSPRYKLKCAIWSPFRGDKLYPYFDDKGDYLALSREYILRDADGTETTYFMTVTDKKVYRWKMGTDWEALPAFAHGFDKNPTIYSHRDRTLCHNIRNIRVRLEQLMSNFADCIDRHFFPYLILEGDIHGKPQKSGKNRMIKITNGGKVYYLNWDQASEAVKLELQELWEKAHTLTNTPNISMEAMRGLGDVPSGRAFQMLFLGTNLEMDNHSEVIGEHIQRRYNFLVSAVGSLNSDYFKASQTIDVEVSLQPFTVNDLAEKIKNAMDACGKPIASLRTGVMMAGLVDNVDDEVKEIEEQEATASMRNVVEPNF